MYEVSLQEAQLKLLDQSEGFSCCSCVTVGWTVQSRALFSDFLSQTGRLRSAIVLVVLQVPPGQPVNHDVTYLHPPPVLCLNV